MYEWFGLQLAIKVQYYFVYKSILSLLGEGGYNSFIKNIKKVLLKCY